jgi:glycosyltransferase involved in cell wall biosynthesis
LENSTISPDPSPTSTASLTASPAVPEQRQATICQLLHSLNVGGAEVLAERLGRKLHDKYRFVFACLDDLGPLGERLQQSGYAVTVLERQPGWDLKCATRLREWLRSERVDLIHAHQYTPFSYALLSGLVRHRPPVLFTEHGRWHPDFPRRKRILFNRTFLRRTDRVVAVGEFVRQALIRNEGLRANRVRIIHNGVDLTQYKPANDPLAKTALRQEFGLPAEALVLMQVARLDGLKDHATALRTLQRLLATHPDAHLVLVGEGPERTAIEAEIVERKLTGQVHLLGLRGDVARLLPAADIFLLTSISEGLPLTIIEAMATHIPVVATNVGGIRELLLDGETGLLADAKDDAALATAILQLAEPSPVKSEMLARAARRAKQLFSEEQNHTAYCQLYAEMLGE